MEKTTGELSLTVVTVVAIVAIAGVIMLLKDPLTNFIEDTFSEGFGSYSNATYGDGK